MRHMYSIYMYVYIHQEKINSNSSNQSDDQWEYTRRKRERCWKRQIYNERVQNSTHTQNQGNKQSTFIVQKRKKKQSNHTHTHTDQFVQIMIVRRRRKRLIWKFVLAYLLLLMSDWFIKQRRTPRIVRSESPIDPLEFPEFLWRRNTLRESTCT